MQTIQGSAKIYQFPKLSRPSNSVRRADSLRETQVPCVEFGGGWYHDAAIEDAASKPTPRNVTPFARH